MHQLKEYEYKLLAKYPGMRPKDEVIWDDFVHSNPDAFDRVWYNVHIGDPATHLHNEEEMIASGAYDVLQWLVDVVAEIDGVFIVIEIKPDARAGALGQALAYKELLIAEHRIPPSSKATVITDELQAITEQAALLLGVQLLIP